MLQEIRGAREEEKGFRPITGLSTCAVKTPFSGPTHTGELGCTKLLQNIKVHGQVVFFWGGAYCPQKLRTSNVNKIAFLKNSTVCHCLLPM